MNRKGLAREILARKRLLLARIIIVIGEPYHL